MTMSEKEEDTATLRSEQVYQPGIEDTDVIAGLQF